MTRTEIIAALKEAKGPFDAKEATDLAFHVAYKFKGFTHHVHLIRMALEKSNLLSMDFSCSAAIALVERVRPGWHWSIYDSNGAGKAEAQIEPPEFSYDPFEGEAATPAIALVLALLQSLEDA